MARESLAERRALVDALLAWYSPAERDIPWRGTRDPYAVWVGEVMAQQTRIGTVIPYYGRFLERFPSLGALADACLDDVLKAWEGLGYYGRARRLHRAAREVMAAYGGALPADPAALRQLPGVGPYTAGALASLAFGLDEPAVDGNVRRVLARIYDLDRPSSGALDAIARALIDARPGTAADLNQSLMDLGSGLCAPRSPSCTVCPVRDRCRALMRGTIADRPPTRPPRPLPHQTVGVGVVWREGLVLIARRPPSGLLGGLWEFPGGKMEEGESSADAVRRELREEVGITVLVGGLLEQIEHAYSHLRVTLYFHEARYVSGRARPRAASEVRWVDPRSVGDYAFPAASASVVSRVSRRS